MLLDVLRQSGCLSKKKLLFDSKRILTPLGEKSIQMPSNVMLVSEKD